MFARRLKWFVIGLAALAGVVVARLVELQVVQAAYYGELAARLTVRPARYLPAPRGSILDRHGAPLVADQPAADVSVHYAVLTFTNRARYLSAVARELRSRGEYPDSLATHEIVSELQNQVARMWQRLSELADVPVATLVARAEATRARVEAIRRAVEARTSIRQMVSEELAYHPILRDVSPEVALAVREEFARYPWVRVTPTARRVASEADACVHLLGRLGEADADRLADDPFGADELRRLRPGDRCGVSGVELLAETILRGARGRVVEDVDGQALERVDPVPGRDVYLTIDRELQSEALALLQEAVEALETPSGGAIVVIDVETRDVLAAVSYPIYSHENFGVEYASLRSDARREPLRFRAIQNRYPPGSTCKAITLVGGLAENVLSPTERIHCTGHLLPNQPNMFRCWIYNQYRTTHDARDPAGQDAELAIKNSCNIYFFRVGDRLGPARLCDWFDRFGIGRPAGTGLIEEAIGVNPTAAWLARYRTSAPRPQPADAWNWSIGQGEVTATPLQIANIGATIASGYWAPARLVRDAQGRPLGPDYPPGDRLPESALRPLRAGMWRVVNEAHGTATTARLDRADYVLCGKTGSAQAQPHTVNWTYHLEFADGRRTTVVAATDADALAGFAAPRPRIVGRFAAERYPALLPDEPLPSHAWFLGFTQAADTPRGRPPQGKSYAICVLVEFGGSGGRVAAPVAKRVAEWLVDHAP